MFGVPFQYTLSRWVLFTFSFNPLYPLILVLSYSYFVCISSLMHVHSCNLWWLNDFIIVAFVCLYTICRILLARLEYLRETFQIEGDFLTFDALVITLLLSGKITPFDWHLLSLCCRDISIKISWNKFEISLMSEASGPMCWLCYSLQCVARVIRSKADYGMMILACSLQLKASWLLLYAVFCERENNHTQSHLETTALF